MFIYVSTSHGLISTIDKEGAIIFFGVSAAVSNGGTLNFMSGLSDAGYSGEVLIAPSYAYIHILNSGKIFLGTGFDVNKSSGTIKLISVISLLGPGGDVYKAV